MMPPNDSLQKKFLLTELMIFGIICLFLYFFGAALLFPLTAKLMGIDDIAAFIRQLSVNSTPSDRFSAKIIMILNQFVTFLAPSLVFLWWIHKRKSIQFLHLNQFPKANLLLFGCLSMICAFPLMNFILKLNQLLPLTENLSDLENKANNTAQVFLMMNTPSEFLMSVLTIAIVPAIAEEVFFRGIIQNYLTKQKVITGIVLTAFVFSAFHQQWASFLPRFFLGIVLGYLFYWSHSLWLPILAHFAFNVMQIIVVYYAFQSLPKSSELSDLLPFTAASIVLTAIFVYLTYINRTRKINPKEV
jgi:uncharacterized protein